MAARGKRAVDHERVALQAKAWELRQKGWTQGRIAKEVGIDQGTVSRWLDAVEQRELARLASKVNRAKAFQNGVLEHLLNESLDAWERSKQPRRRITEKQGEAIQGLDGKTLKGPNGEDLREPPQQVTEVIARDGAPEYLDRAFASLAQLRKLWGLDVAPKLNDESGPKAFSAIVARMRANAARHDAERKPTPTPKPQPETTARADDPETPKE